MLCFMAPFFFSLKILFILMKDTEREGESTAETQAEGGADSMQGARNGTRSWGSRIRPPVEGGAKPLSHPGCPAPRLLKTKSLGKNYSIVRADGIYLLITMKMLNGCSDVTLRRSEKSTADGRLS